MNTQEDITVRAIEYSRQHWHEALEAHPQPPEFYGLYLKELKTMEGEKNVQIILTKDQYIKSIENKDWMAVVFAVTADC